MIEMEELLAEVEVFERGGSASSDLERILVIRYRDALLSGQHGRVAAGSLMRFSASADCHILFTVPHTPSVAGSAPALIFGRAFPGHMSPL
jgi:hypothetical protein